MEHILRLFTTFFLFFPSLGVCPHEARLENLDEEDLSKKRSIFIRFSESIFMAINSIKEKSKTVS